MIGFKNSNIALMPYPVLESSGVSPEAWVTKRAENVIVKNTTLDEGGLSAAITKTFIDYLESINQKSDGL